MLWRDKVALLSALFLAFIVLLCSLGPLLLGDGQSQNLIARMKPPFSPGSDLSGILGTDPLGRSTLERLVVAGQTSLTIAVLATIASLIFGGTVGIAAGFRGGFLESVVMRAADVIMSFPLLLLAILFLYVWEPSPYNIIVLLAIGRLPLYARVARAETLEVKQRLFVDAARCLGASPWRICRQEVAPMVLPTALTLAALDIGVLMLIESALSFLGVGIQPPDISWGALVSEGRRWLSTAWWISFFPGLAIFLTALSCTLLSNWLRLATDPVQRWRLERPVQRPSSFAPPVPATQAPPAARAPASSESTLEVVDLSVEFRTARGTVQAVRNVDFAVARGETLAIIGESGSGKSVTVRAILGTLQSPPAFITSGAVFYRGKNLFELSPSARRSVQGDRITMVFQDALAALNPVYPVGWHIAELFHIHRGTSWRHGYRAGIDLLRKVGIPQPERRVHDYAFQFSGGMRQRAMIALAIALEPDVVLADEPTTALDVTVQAQIMQLLARLRAETGMALVLVTHDVAVAAEVADRIAVMYAGRIVEIGSAVDILRRPRHPYTRALVVLAIDESDGIPAAIPGAPPDMADIPSGCAFHPRCPMARDICRSVEPPQRSFANGQRSACHFAEKVTPDA